MTLQHLWSRPKLWLLVLAQAAVGLLLLSGCVLGTEQTMGPQPLPPPAEAVADVAPTEAAAEVPTQAAATADSAALPWPDATPVPGALVVDTTLPLGPISPYIYGSGYGPWVAVPVDLLDEALASGVKMLRYPGGEWGDRNTMQKPAVERFIKFAREMGAEPTLNMNMLTGTPAEAAEWVRYLNIEKGYGLRYWGIGNEPDLYPDGYTPEQLVTDWRAIAEAMKAVDPTIVLMGPEVSQYATGGPPGPNDSLLFLDAFLAANGDIVDLVTIHRYPFGSETGEDVSVEELLASTAEWDTFIPDLRARIKRLTGRDLPVGVTEINSHWTHEIYGETTPDSYYNAVWLADVIGRLARQRVDIMTHFILASGDEQGGYGIIGNNAVRPSYYTFQLYDRFGEQLRYAASGVELVSLFAAERADGALTLMAINRDTQAAELPLTLTGHPGGTAEVFRIDPERVAAGTANQPLGTAELASGSTVSLPPTSVTLFVLPPAN